MRQGLVISAFWMLNTYQMSKRLVNLWLRDNYFCCFRVIVIFRFWHLGLKLPFHSHLGGVWDIFPSNGVTQHGNTSFEPVSKCTSAAILPVGRIEKNEARTVTNSQKHSILHVWGESLESLPNRFAPKFVCGVMSRMWSCVLNFRMKFWEVAILQGVEISIFLLIFE